LKKAGINIHVLVKSLIRRISVIPTNPGSGPGQAPESRVSCENRNPLSKMFPHFRRDDVWTPVFGELSRAVSTGVTTFYETINISIQFILFVLKDQGPKIRESFKCRKQEKSRFLISKAISRVQGSKNNQAGEGG
jgi:hypothetical protein